MKTKAESWFKELRQKLVNLIESYDSSQFVMTKWNHSGKGGGLMSKIEGDIIEKGGVNISTVSGTFSESMQKRIPVYLTTTAQSTLLRSQWVNQKFTAVEDLKMVLAWKKENR